MIRVSTLSRRRSITVDLAGNLSAAQDGNEGSLRILYGIAEEIDLFLHQITYNAGIYELGNANVGAVCSVSGTECIVYKYISKGKPALWRSCPRSWSPLRDNGCSPEG